MAQSHRHPSEMRHAFRWLATKFILSAVDYTGRCALRPHDLAGAPGFVGKPKPPSINRTRLPTWGSSQEGLLALMADCLMHALSKTHPLTSPLTGSAGNPDFAGGSESVTYCALPGVERYRIRLEDSLVGGKRYLGNHPRPIRIFLT
jgi:hypothetical protein